MHTSLHIELVNFLTFIISRVEGGGVFCVRTIEVSGNETSYRSSSDGSDYVFCLTETYHDSEHCTTIRHNII